MGRETNITKSEEVFFCISYKNKRVTRGNSRHFSILKARASKEKLIPYLDSDSN